MKTGIKGLVLVILVLSCQPTKDLYQAILDNDLAKVSQFIPARYSADETIGTAERSYSPLVLAVTAGRLDIVQYLLEQGGNPDLFVTEKKEISLLTYAAKNEDLKLLELLIAQGAEIDFSNIAGQSTLYLYLKSCNADRPLRQDIFEMLLAAGADLFAPTDRGNSIMDALEPSLASNSAFVATVFDHYIDHAAIPLSRQLSSWARTGNREGSLEPFLLEYLKTVRDRSLLAEKDLLLVALDDTFMQEAPGISQYLWSQCAAEYLGQLQHSTILHDLLRDNKLEGLIFLLAENVSIDGRDENGKSLLQLALEKKLYDLANLLLEKGADVTAADTNQLTPLALIEQDDRINYVDGKLEFKFIRVMTAKDNVMLYADQTGEEGRRLPFGETYKILFDSFLTPYYRNTARARSAVYKGPEPEGWIDQKDLLYFYVKEKTKLFAIAFGGLIAQEEMTSNVLDLALVEWEKGQVNARYDLNVLFSDSSRASDSEKDLQVLHDELYDDILKEVFEAHIRQINDLQLTDMNNDGISDIVLNSNGAGFTFNPCWPSFKNWYQVFNYVDGELVKIFGWCEKMHYPCEIERIYSVSVQWEDHDSDGFLETVTKEKEFEERIYGSPPKIENSSEVYRWNGGKYQLYRQ